MLGTLPGVQDTNLNRDFTQWRSAISITINGMPSQNKDVRVDGINIVDEGGCGTAYVNLNMDAVGEVQVISNGYTAENGRNNGGVISMVTKSGTNQLRASAWYNGRRDRFNENDYFREGDRPGQAALPGQHLRLQRRRTGGDPGPGRQPAGPSGKKFYFFGSQEFTDDARPTSTTRANMPTGPEYNGDFSQTRFGTERPTIQPIIRPDHRPAVPGQQDSGRRHSPHAACSSAASTRSASGCCASCPRPTASSNPAVGQQWTSNSAYDLTPVHGRTNNVVRLDTVFTDKTRMAIRFVKDRDDDWSWNRLTPGTGFVNQNTPGSADREHRLAGAQADGRQRDGLRLHAQPLGLQGGRRLRLHVAVSVHARRRSAAVRAVRRLSTIRRRSAASAQQVDEWPYAPRFTHRRRQPRRAWRGLSARPDEPIPRLNLSGRFYFNDDLSMTTGPPQLQDGYVARVQPQDRARLGRLHGQLQLRPRRQQPAQHRQRLRQHAARRVHDLHRADEPRRSRRPPLAERLLFPGQLARDPAADRRSRPARAAQRFGLRSQQHEQRVLHRPVAARPTPPASTGWPARPACPAITACAAANQRAIDPANPGVFFPTAFAGNIVPGSGQQTQRHHHRRHRRAEGRAPTSRSRTSSTRRARASPGT